MKSFSHNIPIAIAAFAAIFPALNANAFDAENAEGVSFSFTIDSSRTNSVVLTGVADTATGDIDIPSAVSYDGVTYDVNAIDDYAFFGNTKITGVEIPETVTVIGAGAFEDSGLKEIEIPDTVTTMEAEAFAGCKSLTYAYVGTGLTSLPRSEFSNCWALTQVVLGENLKSIGDGAFYADTAITRINSLAEEPPVLGEGALMAVPSSCKVYVLPDAEARYEAADGWSRFNYGITTAVSLPEADVMSVPAEYYDLSGRRLANVPDHGTLYIVKTSEGTSLRLK